MLINKIAKILMNFIKIKKPNIVALIQKKGVGRCSMSF